MPDPSALFEESGAEALVAAVPALLEDDDSAVDLLISLQTDAVPSRWHRRITAAVVGILLERDDPPGIWLTDWIAVADRFERLHPDERAALRHRNLTHAPDDDVALREYVACQLEDEYLHDGDLGSLPSAEPRAPARFGLIADLLTWRIGHWKPARESARERLSKLDHDGRTRVGSLLAGAGWEGALTDLEAS